MQSKERMQLISLAIKDLAEAVAAYEEAQAKCKYGSPSVGYGIPAHYSKEAIKRRIVTLRQDLKQLEDAL